MKAPPVAAAEVGVARRRLHKECAMIEEHRLSHIADWTQYDLRAAVPVPLSRFYFGQRVGSLRPQPQDDDGASDFPAEHFRARSEVRYQPGVRRVVGKEILRLCPFGVFSQFVRYSIVPWTDRSKTLPRRRQEGRTPVFRTHPSSIGCDVVSIFGRVPTWRGGGI